ncbi:MAG TPA: hypothetical protein DCP90_09555 [Clostridiales bacterium]|nr:MAG: hypothetical protein A2Y22_08370 [Clostridiales bacterium GWD2_32_59]HAN10834.1 hypothetical protein [Clostridiales bacterium]
MVFQTMGRVERIILDYVSGIELEEILVETVCHMTENNLMYVGVNVYGETDCETVAMILSKINREAVELDVGKHEAYFYYKENKALNHFGKVMIIKDEEGYLFAQ